MNRDKAIKDMIGSKLTEKNFKYVRREQGIVWTFGRQLGDVKQEVYVQKHTKFDDEYKLMFWSSAKGNGMREIGSVLPEYKDKEYWKAETDEEFLKMLEFFVSFIGNYGFELLDNMLDEKPDSFETPEIKKYFKEHRQELIEKYNSKYHILDAGTSEDQLRMIDDILYEKRKADDSSKKQKEVNDFLLGMAAILSEIIVRTGKATIDYDAYRVEIVLPNKVFNMMPIFIIVQAWLRYHMGGERSIALVWGMSRMTVQFCEG